MKLKIYNIPSLSKKNKNRVVKSVAFGFVLFFLQSELRSQCPANDILLETQEQVDSFQYNYPNCTEITKAINIKGLGITNLNGLSVLTNIKSLSIDSTLIVNLNGLNNITELRNMTISNNLLLLDISAIGQVSKINFSFEILNNDALVNLAGLSLDSLGYCIIENNDALITLHGLENLTCVMYRLKIDSNRSLLDLTGLRNLTLAQNELLIINNDRIKNLEGLENLLSVGWNFTIQGNDSLQSLAGLEHVQIQHQLIESFYINHNHQLDSCHIEPMCQFIADGHIVRFEDNAQGCNNNTEVIELCMQVDSEDPISFPDFYVYPNPTHGLLFYSYTEAENLDHITIYNRMGVEVLRSTQHDGSIDFTQLPPGLYMVKFSLKNSIKAARVVKL